MRIKIVSTSTNGQQFNIEANYNYYLHGPLARTLLGSHGGVQGLDYVYTIQGWLKGVNGSLRKAWMDIGKDGWVPEPGNNYINPNVYVGRDALAYTLSYFDDDYKPTGGSAYQPELSNNNNTWIYNFSGNLYNGNIRNMTVDIQELEAMGTAYRYDQLNRLKGTRTMFNPDYQDWEWSQTAVRTNAYEESDITYDKNGNITSYVRNDEGGNVMDDLEYFYTNNTNQLELVKDYAGVTTYTEDIESQSTGNYTYDAIGNLISDNSEGLSIFWNNFGKVDSISDSNDYIALKYIYDPSGNRIEKRFYPSNGQPNIRNVTYYVRDAQGNILATYNRYQDCQLPTFSVHSKLALFNLGCIL